MCVWWLTWLTWFLEKIESKKFQICASFWGVDFISRGQFFQTVFGLKQLHQLQRFSTDIVCVLLMVDLVDLLSRENREFLSCVSSSITCLATQRLTDSRTQNQLFCCLLSSFLGFWSSKVLYGHVSSCIILFGLVWFRMFFYCLVQSCIFLYSLQWCLCYCMVSYGLLQSCTLFYGVVWS